MNAMADAIVYAVTYINLKQNPEPEPDEDGFIDEGEHDDADVGALESIAFALRSASEAEKNALAAAAERQLAEERAGPDRAPFIETLSTWMERVFDDEEWSGNRRRAGG